ncbi:hypothetical protein LAZ67_16001890 [Cordylochernes scorpioides]|uniref:Uncharacterized protein n=1 Tax=Cordylochernes scorpioides TaxID=51811 RepID=A0ABY6LGB4_9ARAC|nr:hypothetical protein LAZ67_16001890 [Cordylochernes scorpioides]
MACAIYRNKSQLIVVFIIPKLAKNGFLINQEKLTTYAYRAVGPRQRGANCTSTTKKSWNNNYPVNISIIQIYAPTTKAEEYMNDFYDKNYITKQRTPATDW